MNRSSWKRLRFSHSRPQVVNVTDKIFSVCNKRGLLVRFFFSIYSRVQGRKNQNESCHCPKEIMLSFFHGENNWWKKNYNDNLSIIGYNQWESYRNDTFRRLWSCVTWNQFEVNQRRRRPLSKINNHPNMIASRISFISSCR